VTTRATIFVFALSLTVAAATPSKTIHQKARQAMAEAEQTSNPVRLLVLALQIRENLEEARRQAPDDVNVRLDLIRFYMNAPGMLGGDIGNARTEAAEIAKRDAALGHFASGYVSYREKKYGPARLELQEAVRTAKTSETRALALKWLGWLSQETQQWTTAFETFESLRSSDPAALYEIGRTAVFCGCELSAGKKALEEYARALPKDARGRLQLALLYEKLGDVRSAKREADVAWRLDKSIPGLKEARKRLGVRRR
jgi:tetratricopeptide (TPR) repeat protein